MKNLFFILSLFCVSAVYGSDIIINGTLLGGSAAISNNWFPLMIKTLEFGAGCNFHKDAGFLVSCRAGDAWLTPFSGDYLTGANALSLYFYLTNGIKSGKSMTSPVVYAYCGGNHWIGMYDIHYFEIGAGTKWTFIAISPAIETGIRFISREETTMLSSTHYFLKGSFDIGGWWPATDVANAYNTTWGKRITWGCIGLSACYLLYVFLL